MKRIVSLLLGLVLIFGVISPVLAQDTEVLEATSEADVQGTEDEIVDVNSFELFWPVVAGKVRGDTLYGLKSLKEKVMGWFVFGDAKKSDYEMFLATKRVVEAEKLINEGEDELAIRTFMEAEESVDEAKENWDEVENKANEGDVMINIKKQLTNIEVFLNYLKDKNDGAVKDGISKLNLKVTEFIISL